mmetsp:Transcript_39294/g.93082  ORF Transcript_39294/g.93082 Transcript_39294/m.93082 type:complete len:87 (+) Transcript_39294:115-375(+)
MAPFRKTRSVLEDRKERGMEERSKKGRAGHRAVAGWRASRGERKEEGGGSKGPLQEQKAGVKSAEACAAAIARNGGKEAPRRLAPS